MLLQYNGLAKGGEKISGEFLGTKEELVGKMQTEGILLTAVSEKKRRLKDGRYRLSDFAKDIEELSYLVSSGLQIDKAIVALIKNLKKKTAIHLWEEILSGIRGGRQFSSSIQNASEKQNFAISDFYINIISVGEEVGNIQAALKDVSEHLQFRDAIAKETVSALAYPAFLIMISLAAIFFIAYFILPRFATIFTAKEMQQIPTISRLLIEFGQFIHNNSALVLSFSFFIIISISMLFSLDKPRRIVLEAMQKLPLIKGIALELQIANLCSSIGVMLEGGVDIGRSMRLSKKIVSDKSLKNIIEETADGLRKGLRISEMWTKYSIIPDDVISLVAVGEHSAKLGEIFAKLGTRHLGEFKAKIARAMTFLEPAMIIFLGIFIGTIVVAIMMAVMSLTNVS